jgi:hypothetical protein
MILIFSAYNQYPVNRLRRIIDTLKDKDFIKVIDSGKRLLIMVEETALSKTEMEFLWI